MKPIDGLELLVIALETGLAMLLTGLFFRVMFAVLSAAKSLTRIETQLSKLLGRFDKLNALVSSSDDVP